MGVALSGCGESEHWTDAIDINAKAMNIRELSLHATVTLWPCVAKGEGGPYHFTLYCPLAKKSHSTVVTPKQTVLSYLEPL